LKILRDKSVGVIVLSLIGYLGINPHLCAQTELNELTVDRPGIAESPFTVSPGTFQFETGFDYFSRYNGDIYYLPVMLFRTGLSNSAELRITERQIIDYTGEESIKGFSPLNVGVKVHIIKQNGWIPETDILTNLVIPMGSSSLQPNYNIGYLWYGIDQGDIFTASFCFNYLPTNRIGCFLEYYTFSASWPGEQGMDGGMTYLLRHNLQLDMSGGISRQDGHTNFFLSTGFSIRIQTKSAQRKAG
jgi:Putative MetA-pathway of phenol degradation